MNIEDLYSLYKKSYLVDTDTRNIRKNSLFFALKGANFNGNKFAQQALDKGASYSIVDEVIDQKTTSKNIIIVANVLQTLQDLANYHRLQLGIPIISLTGSNGKTTTKELINAVLSKKYKTLATFGNLNNHIGVPLTLLSLTKETEIGIIEMGANHHNEIATLSKIVAPDFGYITNFGKAHLEGFGSVEGVIEAKSELYDFLLTNSKHIFVNPFDNIQVEKTQKGNCIYFDKNTKLTSSNPFVTLTYKGHLINSNLIGDYNYNNIVAAITIGEYFNVATTKIIEAIENYIPKNNRSQIINTTSNQIILDAYNANPSSMEVAIKNFSKLEATKKVLILGDMFELGKDSVSEHNFIADLSNNLSFHEILLVGENFHKTTNNLKKFITFEALKDYVISNQFTETSILIKGSRGMKLERLLDYIS